jgi:hypothetical protein
VLRRVARWAPEYGERESGCGPERGMEGRDQEGEEEEEEGMDTVVLGAEDDFSAGAPPMMPPSMNFTSGASAWKCA